MMKKLGFLSFFLSSFLLSFLLYFLIIRQSFISDYDVNIMNALQM